MRIQGSTTLTLPRNWKTRRWVVTILGFRKAKAEEPEKPPAEPAEPWLCGECEQDGGVARGWGY